MLCATCQKRMMLMSLIPCTSACIYQSDGVCTLDSAAAAGVPALGGACIHFIPSDAKQLGSPHRYFEPAAAPTREMFPDSPSGGLGPRTV